MIDALWSGERWERRLRTVGVHALVVAHAGRTECAWFRRHDGAARPAKLNSVTKSITGMLTGVVDIDVSSSALSHLPPVPIDDERKKAITVEHLLGMTSGLQWPEFGAWRGATPPLTGSKDLVRSVIGQPLIAEPGSAMWYSTGSSHLLGAVLHERTGRSVEQLAEEHLFRPSGIRRWRFHADRKGYSHAGNGLSLLPTDLARLGTAVLRQEIASLDWLRECWRPRTRTYPWIGAYGWHWWVDEDLAMVFALGMGGQLLALFPGHELVVVMTGGNSFDDTLNGVKLLRQAYHGH